MCKVISSFIEIFEPFKNVTLKLLYEQVDLRDFYGIWLKFKFDFGKQNYIKLDAFYTQKNQLRTNK